MRIAELSRTSGVPPATIKYYLREGLLQPGLRTHRNQVEYGDEHVNRLRLVRALVDIGGISISAASELITVLDTGDLPARKALGEAMFALGARRSPVGADQQAAAEADVAGLLARRAWSVDEQNPARHTLTDVCAALRQLGHTDVLAKIDDYAAAAEAVAAVDIDLVRAVPSVERMTETAIVGTILGDTMLSALRRLAQEHVSGLMLPDDD
ncbi:MerR family transcriptional regulator [Nocardia brasiliensis]|uniref:MerR family transcriptional regulator n=1 Tax=Nocardia brasiliensis TaxID=37326 RepID=A0A6G9XU76_NOCBR|nr:MerR family transcriptional regulator [Nocardia brasiliensis]QIS04511.1 MerR family transcriptional regulator [Nocardia brasiliensis]